MFESIQIRHEYGSYNDLTLYLDDPEGSMGFAIVSVDGLGAGKATTNTVDWAILDGSSLANIRIPKRTITIELRFIERYNDESNKYESVADIREKSYWYFPMKKQVRLYFTKIDYYGHRTVYYIDGIVDKNEPNIWSNAEGCSIEILCLDPFFKDNTEEEISFTQITDHFHFIYPDEDQDTGTIVCTHPDAETPVGPVSSIITYDTLPIENASNIDVGAIFEIQCLGGTVKNPEIINKTTNEHFRLLYTMTEGETITINTRDATHTIVSNKTDNILAYVDLRADDWISFSPGINEIKRKCDNSDHLDYFLMTVKLKPRFVGI